MSKKIYLFELWMRVCGIFLFLFFSFSVRGQVLSEELDSVSMHIQQETYTDESDEEKEYEEDQVLFLKTNDSTRFTDSVSIRKIPDSVLQKLKKDGDFWYANLVFRKNETPQSNFTVPKFVSVLLWLIIIGGFAGFIIWYLANSNVGLFRGSSKKITSGDEEIETDNIFEINYEREIGKAVSAGNHRFAIRLMYLRLLKNLSQRNIIRYKLERTNFDYLLQLSSTNYYHDFFRVTRNYEYSWYGLFDVNEETFELIKNDFTHLEQKANVA